MCDVRHTQKLLERHGLMGLAKELFYFKDVGNIPTKRLSILKLMYCMLIFCGIFWGITRYL